jgi:hypothetical protein
LQFQHIADCRQNCGFSKKQQNTFLTGKSLKNQGIERSLNRVIDMAFGAQ